MTLYSNLPQTSTSTQIKLRFVFGLRYDRTPPYVTMPSALGSCLLSLEISSISTGVSISALILTHWAHSNSFQRDPSQLQRTTVEISTPTQRDDGHDREPELIRDDTLSAQAAAAASFGNPTTYSTRRCVRDIAERSYNQLRTLTKTRPNSRFREPRGMHHRRYVEQ